MKDFARARYLEPNSGNLCNAEALLWMPYDPSYAVPAWRMAISRNHLLAQGYFNWMCSQMQGHAELRHAARMLATKPGLKLTYLSYAEKEEFSETLNELLPM